MVMRKEPPTRTSRTASAQVAPPGHIHSRIPSGSIQASKTTSQGAGNRRLTTTRCLPSVELSMHNSSLSTLVLSLYVSFERIQALSPELAVIFQPQVGFTQRARIDRAVMFPAPYFAAHETHAFEHHNVLGNCIQRNRKGLGDLVDRGRTFSKHPQNRATCGIAERREDAVQFTPSGIFTHMDEY